MEFLGWERDLHCKRVTLCSPRLIYNGRIMPIPGFLSVFDLTWIDLTAVLLFGGGWAAYVYFAAWHGKRVPSLHNSMDRYRREWMVRMVERDNRMMDVNVMRNITRSSQFFASTTMLILGALIAAMGYVPQTQDVVSGLPFTVRASTRLLEIKLLLLVMIFVVAFFKFSWAIRQLGFSGILMAATPKTPAGDPEQFAAHINRIARITSYAGSNFNHGLRSYYFALAAMAWPAATSAEMSICTMTAPITCPWRTCCPRDTAIRLMWP